MRFLLDNVNEDLSKLGKGGATTKLRLLSGFILIIFLLIGCGLKGPYFGSEDRASFVPPAFEMTQEAISKAEMWAGAKYSPEKIAKA